VGLPAHPSVARSPTGKRRLRPAHATSPITHLSRSCASCFRTYVPHYWCTSPLNSRFPYIGAQGLASQLRWFPVILR
jgi:hypothetical protein